MFEEIYYFQIKELADRNSFHSKKNLDEKDYATRIFKIVS